MARVGPQRHTQKKYYSHQSLTRLIQTTRSNSNHKVISSWVFSFTLFCFALFYSLFQNFNVPVPVAARSKA